MNSRFIMPDYTNSNLNITATLAEFLGAPNKNAILPNLMEELSKGYNLLLHPGCFLCIFPLVYLRLCQYPSALYQNKTLRQVI